jgi:hypothetical protein
MAPRWSPPRQHSDARSWPVARRFGQGASRPVGAPRLARRVGRRRVVTRMATGSSPCFDRLAKALAVSDGLSAQRAQIVVVDRTCGADHARATRHGELDGGAADPAGGAVDEQRAPGPGAERVQGGRGRLDGDGQSGGLGEAKRRRDRRVVGEQRQLGGSRRTANHQNQVTAVHRNGR